MGLGSLRTIAARIVRALDSEGLLGSHVIVAGTNALHAYETACGIQIKQEHVATTNADTLWDPRQSLLLAATGVRKQGLMGILWRIDRSFTADDGYNATNKDGYIVDLICPDVDNFTKMNVGSDLEAVPMAGIEWLLRCPQFEQVLVAEDGMPVRMIVPEPRTFALHKLWVSHRDDRDPSRRLRDVGHATVVAEICAKYLRLKFVAKEMPWLPKELKALIPQIKNIT